MKNPLGVIYIETKYDSPEDFVRIQNELDQTVKDDYFIVKIDGDQRPDLAVCLNSGIRACIKANAQYIHWAHPDFHYDDPNWYTILRNTLEAYPEILKICASNSRDGLGPWRIGQEQSWLMRSSDFLNPWLFFDERFEGIGGYEDWMQSYFILAYGYLVCITPETTIYHKGAQSRGRHDTTKEQWLNHDLYCRIVSQFGSTSAEPHRPELFGCHLSLDLKKKRLESTSKVLQNKLKLV